VRIINILFVFFCLISSSSSWSACRSPEEIVLSDVWVRENKQMHGNTAAFMEIHNRSSENLTLVRAEVNASHRVELHTHKKDKCNNVYRMRPIKNIPVASGKTVILQPGGLHIMLMKIRKPLFEGQLVHIKLILEDKMGNIIEKDIDAEVRKGPCHCHHHEKAQKRQEALDVVEESTYQGSEYLNAD
jgi:copper(I)-binding protein